MLNSRKRVFEFRFYTYQNEKLNYNEPDLSADRGYLYNVMGPEVPRCPRLKRKDFDYQYSYYINEDNSTCIFSVYLSKGPNFNISHAGALGIFIRKVMVIHYPDAPTDSCVKIYLPNYTTPITKLVKATFRLDCVQDLVLSLKDDYSIELL
jgi:hypothetical protein